MNRLIKIIIALLIAFALSSLLVYRVRLGDAPALQTGIASRAVQSEIKTVEGQIGIVDTGANILTLIDGSREVTFTFDGRTTIVESGRAVQPGSIPQGAPAAVKYTQRGGKNWARKIELLTARSSGTY
ncbi:MAG TPA: hypothetical protein VJZ26_15580 [Blastocatellia bacterium]|nr:hypothetical protein [Blastocatellia bacterium]